MLQGLRRTGSAARPRAQFSARPGPRTGPDSGVLAGRRVLVTGAAGAFGTATMAALRRRGARVAGIDVTGGTLADAVGGIEIDRVNGVDDVIRCDVADGEQVATAVGAAVDRLGGLDALIHYAGVGEPGDAGAAPGPEVDRSIDVNLLGPWRVTAAALPALLQTGGRVVVVASELAYATLPFAGPYAVSKRALTAYADALRLEHRGHLAVTTVYPGYVRTPIHERSAAMGLSMEGMVRPERVSDVARTVLGTLAAARPPRDVAATRIGRLELWLARHLPAAVDAAVRSRLAREIAGGRYDDVPLAQGVVRRYRGGSRAEAATATGTPPGTSTGTPTERATETGKAAVRETRPTDKEGVAR